MKCTTTPQTAEVRSFAQGTSGPTVVVVEEGWKKKRGEGLGRGVEVLKYLRGRHQITRSGARSLGAAPDHSRQRGRSAQSGSRDGRRLPDHGGCAVATGARWQACPDSASPLPDLLADSSGLQTKSSSIEFDYSAEKVASRRRFGVDDLMADQHPLSTLLRAAPHKQVLKLQLTITDL